MLQTSYLNLLHQLHSDILTPLYYHFWLSDLGTLINDVMQIGKYSKLRPFGLYNGIVDDLNSESNIFEWQNPSNSKSIDKIWFRLKEDVKIRLKLTIFNTFFIFSWFQTFSIKKSIKRSKRTLKMLIKLDDNFAAPDLSPESRVKSNTNKIFFKILAQVDSIT